MKKPTRRKSAKRRVPLRPDQPAPSTRAAEPQPAVGEPLNFQNPMVLLALAAMVALFAWAYWPTLHRLVRAWNREPDYGHGYFVAPLALLFLYVRRDLFPGMTAPRLWQGLGLIGISIAIRITGALAFVDAIDAWSMLFWIAGVVWLFCGTAVVKWAAPAIGFLFFMIPIPYQAERALSLQLQAVATKISSWTLQFIGQPAIAEGNTILLGEHELGVAEACSGMRIFMGSIALAAAYMILVRRTWWERGLLLLFIIPVALVANALRIVCTSLLFQYTSINHGVAHDVSGYIMIPLAAALFGGVVWYLGKLIQHSEKIDVGEVVRQGT